MGHRIGPGGEQGGLHGMQGTADRLRPGRGGAHAGHLAGGHVQYQTTTNRSSVKTTRNDSLALLQGNQKSLASSKWLGDRSAEGHDPSSTKIAPKSCTLKNCLKSVCFHETTCRFERIVSETKRDSPFFRTSSLIQDILKTHCRSASIPAPCPTAASWRRSGSLPPGRPGKFRTSRTPRYRIS